MVQEFEDLLAAFDEGAPAGTTYTGVSEKEIAEAEEELSIKFPPSYRWFLGEIGAANWPDMVYGLGPQVPHYLNVVRMTYSEQREVGNPMPPFLIPICPDGAGNHYCLDSSQQVIEYPIVFWQHDLPNNQVPQPVAISFSVWLQEFIDEYSD